MGKGYWCRLLGNFICSVDVLWSAGGYIRAWKLEDSSVTGTFSLSPGFAMQLYAAFGITGAIFILFLNYTWLRRWLQKRSRNHQFSLLEGSIDNIIKNHKSLSMDFEAQYRVFTEEIKKFRIYVPPRIETVEDPFSYQPEYKVIRQEWMDWMVSMKGFVATKNLKAARRYSDGIRRAA